MHGTRSIHGGRRFVEDGLVGASLAEVGGDAVRGDAGPYAELVADGLEFVAGTGVRHSEKNASDRERVHLLQIWIMPNAESLAPGYEQKAFSEEERRGQLRLIASEDGRDDSVRLNQDVSLFASILDDDQEVERTMDANRYGWIQVARGSIAVNGEKAEQGDGVVIVAESSLSIRAEEPAEILLFDLQ